MTVKATNEEPTTTNEATAPDADEVALPPETPATPPAEGEKVAPKEGDAPPPEKTAEEPKRAKAKDLADVMRAKQAAIKAKKDAALAAHETRTALERERADLARREQAIARVEAKLRELPSAPEKALELLGIDKETFFRRIVNDGKTTPEEENAQIRAELAAMKKEIAERETANQRAAARANEEAAYGGFADAVLGAEEKYPNATVMFSREEIAAEAKRVVEWARTKGYVYRDDEIADFIDKKALAQYNEVEKRKNDRASRTKNEPHAAGSQAANGHTTRPGTTRTLTNRGAQERATPPRQETEEEMDARLLAELKAATKADREARGA